MKRKMLPLQYPKVYGERECCVCGLEQIAVKYHFGSYPEEDYIYWMNQQRKRRNQNVK